MIEDAYLDHLVALPTSMPREPNGTPVTVVYSALHGVGAALTAAAFARTGFGQVVVVDEQRDPDATFPTVASPNPEDEDALALTREQAERTRADVALVHDPDADRLGVLVPDDAGWRALTGNEIGLLLADHVLTRTAGEDRLVVDTVVSSSALARLAAAHEVHHVRTLTGFKWIVRPAIDRPELRFVFGYEEALGYSVDAYVRDKDGISAALAFRRADLGSATARDRTVTDRLRELAVAHGLFSTDSWVLAGTDPAAGRDRHDSGCADRDAWDRRPVHDGLRGGLRRRRGVAAFGSVGLDVGAPTHAWRFVPVAPRPSSRCTPRCGRRSRTSRRTKQRPRRPPPSWRSCGVATMPFLQELMTDA